MRFILGELFDTWSWQLNERKLFWLYGIESCCVGVEGSSKNICVRRFSPSALSLFRFHQTPFPQKRLILRLDRTPTASDRPCAPQRNQCFKVSHFLAIDSSLGAQVQTDIHPYCDQLTALKTGYPLTSATWPYRGLRNRPLEVEYFLRLSSDKFLVFKWSQVQVQFFKCTGNKLCLRAALIKFRFQSYPRMWKFSQFLKVGKTVDTRVGHAIIPPFMHWLVNIWQVS